MSDTPPSSPDQTPRSTPAVMPTAEPVAAIPPSLTTPPPPAGALTHPQIVAALITGIVSVLVAVVGIIPVLIEAGKDDSTPTPVSAALVSQASPTVAPTVTGLPPTAVDTQSPPPATDAVGVPNIVDVGATTTPLPVLGDPLPPTGEPAAATISDSVSTAPEPNLRLYFDNVSFTVRNQGGGKKTLAGVVFYNEHGRWDAEQWGSFYDDLTNRDCLRIRDVATSPRDPPSDCRELIGLMLVGPAAIFWRGDDGFRVERRGVELALCTSSPCDLYLPRD
jgi:hypothetical protein